MIISNIFDHLKFFNKYVQECTSELYKRIYAGLANK